MKAFLLGLILFIGVGIIGMATNIITIPWLKLGSQVQMERQIIQKTYNADNAIYNYHWFQERLGAIKATESKIENAQFTIENFELSAGDRSAWTFEDKNEQSRLNTVLLGLKNHYSDLVEEYNARANESDRSIFQDELPMFFSIKPF